MGAVKRQCFSCRRPILKNHKWHIVGCYIMHDDCQNPTMRLLVRAPEPAVQPLLEGTAGEESDET